MLRVIIKCALENVFSLDTKFCFSDEIIFVLSQYTFFVLKCIQFIGTLQ